MLKELEATLKEVPFFTAQKVLSSAACLTSSSERNWVPGMAFLNFGNR